MEVSFPLSYFAYPHSSLSTDLDDYVQVSMPADCH